MGSTIMIYMVNC